MQSNVLLCALDELDDPGDDGDHEPDGTQDLEEGAEAAHPDRSLADLLAHLARICASCCQRPALFTGKARYVSYLGESSRLLQPRRRFPPRLSNK